MQVLAGLFGESVATEEVDLLADATTDLLSEEAAALRSAASGRLLEYRAGRHCARVALARLGVVGVPVLRAADRTPIWPEGIVGSIAHTRSAGRGWCGAAVARRTEVRSVGLDAEVEAPLETNLWARVLRAAEREWVEAQAVPAQGDLAKLVFSAKESTYKCLYPLSRRFLEFHDVEIAIRPEGAFLATLLVDAAPFRSGDSFVGCHVRRDGLIVTALTLE